MSNLTAYERETVMQTSDDTDLWTISTYQKKMITKFKNAGAKIIKELKDNEGKIIGYQFELDFNKITIRKSKDINKQPKKQISQEHKEKLQEALRLNREKKKNKQ